MTQRTAEGNADGASGATEIVIEGSGMVAPFAAGCAAVVLEEAGRHRECPAEARYWAVGDELLEEAGDFPAEVRRDRLAWITAVALRHAWQDAGLDWGSFAPDRIALVVGNAFAGQLGMISFANEVRAQSARFVSPIHFPQTVGNYVAGVMSRAFKIHGPNITVASGASAGLTAVASACDLLANDEADVAIAGGAEILSEPLVRGLGVSRAGRSNEDVWAEGACMFVLRRASGVPKSKPRIVQWTTTAAQPQMHDTFNQAVCFGRALAAESASRLAAAAAVAESKPQLVRQIEHTTACTLTVEPASPA